MAKIKILNWGYRCERCEHDWIPRIKKKVLPITCPGCKSPYWNNPRKNKTKIFRKNRKIKSQVTGQRWA